MSPTISSKKKEKRVMKSRRSMERERVIFLGLLAGCVATILIHLVVQVILAAGAAKARELKVEAAKSQRLLVVMESEEKFERELEIAKKAQVEDTAGKNRREEWTKRKDMHPELAHTQMEKNMLEMKRIGEDPEYPDKKALKKIAELASPPRSGVGVSKERRGYKVELAFPYDEVIDSHPEVKGYMPGIYREVRRTAAGIMRDLFAFGDSHRIYSVLISCQGMVTVSSREGRKRELRDMFVVRARERGKRWEDMDRAEAEGEWRLVKDVFPDLMDSL